MAQGSATPTRKRIKDLGARIAERPTNDELAEVLQQAAKAGNDIRYDHTAGIVAALVSAGIAIIALMNEAIWVFIASLLAAAILAALVWDRMSTWSSLETSLQELYEDNLAGLRPIPTSTMPLSFFGEFQRGNYSREIRRLRVGERTLNDATFAYTIVDYHWVDRVEHVETYTDSQGRMRQRVVVRYYHYDRVGIALDLGAPGRLCVYSQDGHPVPKGTWTTADPAFNDRFQVRCSTEMVAATLLTPAVVLKILELTNVASDVNVEVNDGGWMLVSFAPTNLVAADGPLPSIKDLGAATRIVRTAPKQPLLDAFFGVVEDISRHVRS